LAHFAAIATLATVDGELNPEEFALLNQFAEKLDITEEEYKEVIKNSNKYPIDPPSSSKKRLERLYDLFRIIFADHVIDTGEMVLIKKYAIGMGYSHDDADKIISRSVEVFSGKLSLDDYLYLLNH
jgi:uncharacterized tellurite resistance protein B-like protein